MVALPDVEPPKAHSPRGKYAVEMYKTYMRMHGKTYDYKIMYKDFEKFFLLQKPDRHHCAFVMSLAVPIRQGQQRYQHLVMQMTRDHSELAGCFSQDRELDKPCPVLLWKDRVGSD